MAEDNKKTLVGYTTTFGGKEFNPATGDFRTTEPVYRVEPKKKKVVRVKKSPFDVQPKKESKYTKDYSSAEQQAAISEALQEVLNGRLPSDPDILAYLTGNGFGEYDDIMPIRVSVPKGIIRGKDGAPFEREQVAFDIEPMIGGNVLEDYSRRGVPYGKDFYDYITNILPGVAGARGKVPVFIGDVNKRKRSANDIVPQEYSLDDWSIRDNVKATSLPPVLQGRDRDYSELEHSDRASNMLTAILNRSHDFTPLLAPKLAAVDKSDTGKSIPIKLINKKTGQVEKKFIPIEPYYNSPLYNWNTDMWRNSPELVEKLFADPQYARDWKSWGVADQYANDATGLPEVTENINTEGIAAGIYDDEGVFHAVESDAPSKVRTIQPLDYANTYANLTAQGRYFPDVYSQYGSPQAYAEEMARQGYNIKFQPLKGEGDIWDRGMLREAKAQYQKGKEADESFANRSDADRKAISDNNAEVFSNMGDVHDKEGRAKNFNKDTNAFEYVPTYKTVSKFNQETGRNEFTPEAGKHRDVRRRLFIKNMFSPHEKNAAQLDYLTNSLGLSADTDRKGIVEWTNAKGAGKDVWDSLSGQYNGAALAKQLAEAYTDWKSQQPANNNEE